MLTINSIDSKLAITRKNNLEIQQKTSSVAFKGALGDQLLKEAASRKTVPTVETVFNKIESMFGLSTARTKDVLESLLSALKNQLSEISGLLAKKNELENRINALELENKSLKEDKEEIIQQGAFLLKNTKEQIASKDAKIAELQKYEAMSKVKSVDEIDIVMPEQVFTLLEEIKANDEIAHNSLFEYVMTGKGQEEFLKQIERNEILRKAKKDGVDKIPEVKNAIDTLIKDRPLDDYPSVSGVNSYSTACRMLQKCLTINPKGFYIKSPVVYEQVRKNAEALIEPMREENSCYETSVSKTMQEVLKFQDMIENSVMRLENEFGLKYLSEVSNTSSYYQSYKSFKDEKNGVINDFAIVKLMSGMLGDYVLKDLEGNIISRQN